VKKTMVKSPKPTEGRERSVFRLPRCELTRPRLSRPRRRKAMLI
jgi:hypothetical protein